MKVEKKEKEYDYNMEIKLMKQNATKENLRWLNCWGDSDIHWEDFEGSEDQKEAYEKAIRDIWNRFCSGIK